MAKPRGVSYYDAGPLTKGDVLTRPWLILETRMPNHH